jgi:hypothetical protein
MIFADLSPAQAGLWPYSRDKIALLFYYSRHINSDENLILYVQSFLLPGVLLYSIYAPATSYIIIELTKVNELCNEYVPS